MWIRKYYDSCSHGCRERAFEENGNDCSPDNGVCVDFFIKFRGISYGI